MNFLEKKKIITQVHYIPIPFHPLYKKLGYKMKNLSNAKEYYETAVSIPIFYNLKEKYKKKISFILKELLKNIEK